MTTFRDQKRDMRRKVHQTMRIPAFYYPPGQDGTYVDKSAFVRLTSKFGQANMAERQYGLPNLTTADPKLIFLLAERDPDQNAIVALDVGEVYRISAVEEPDDITVTAVCTRLLPEDAVEYASPATTARAAAMSGGFLFTAAQSGAVA